MKKLYQRLMPLAIAVLSIGVALPAFAQPGRLVSRDRGSQINVRSEPSTESRAKHYGYAGDRVEVSDSTEGDDGYIWFYVRFSSSGAEGWVRGDFIQLSR